MIEFVYFDLGNILWTFDEDRACRNAGKLLNVEPEVIRKTVYQSELQTQFEHGQVSSEAFVEEIGDRLSLTRDPSQTQQVLDALSDMFTPIESMVGVMDSVRKAGKRVGILSNTCQAHWDWIRRQNHALMAGPFDAIVLSHEVNSMKPDDQIYRAAELIAGVPTDQILFVDDKAENVVAAKRRGWKAEQCLSDQDVIESLVRHQVIGASG